MAEERMIVLNLREDLVKAGRRKRGNRLVRILRESAQKNFKDQKIIVDKAVNDEVWKNLPTRLKLKLTKVDEKTVKVELGK